ncbi:MAG: tetratricopeptide repeat protein [Bryobacterales bacterium]|nr:tetratricopeptide repeat protein [Bryobacteraceae bacterium]MDW8355370.1 tetratricopeptide repeat protein [Bryobacterales bacterium]
MVVWVALCSGSAHAQVSQLEGKVIGEDGAPLQNAIIRIERKDIRGNYKTKTNRKGEYIHAGLPLGVYRVVLEVDGRDVDAVDNVRTRLGEPVTINFNLKELRDRQQALARAAETGTLTQEQARELTPEQKAAFERAMKERQAQLARGRALNDAFNAGMTALQAKQWEPAIEAFTKAAEIDPKQHVIWGQLAEAYVGLAGTKTGAEMEAVMQKAFEAYQKAMELNPTDAGYRNNYALALAKARKFEEAQAELVKAAQLDPSRAGQFYYNLGAVLVNIGQTEPAGEAFKKAIEADPNYANAYYQYAVYLFAKATLSPDGRVVPPAGTREALEKYLQLEPNGTFAESARGMLATIEQSVQTQYVNPEAQKKKTTKKK